MHTEPAVKCRELAPHPALRPWIECFWTRCEPAALAREHRVLPDGCADFLFDRGRGRAWLIGAMSRPFEFVPEGPVDFVAVRFRPGALHHLVRDALDAWTDARVELGELDAWGRTLAGEVGQAEDTPACLHRLEQRLLLRLASARPDPIDHVLSRLAADPAAFRVGEAASAAGLTRQWLTRSIRSRTGLGPKELARILRLRRSLAAIERGRPLVDAALDAGYADQAHLAREARRITGLTPSALRPQIV